MHIRHQIDLMDMGQKGAAKFNGSSYRYLLSVMDVFSRFVWLRPMNKKMSKNVEDELRSIYLEHVPPRVIQCDQGSEFKGAVKELCRRLGILLKSTSGHQILDCSHSFGSILLLLTVPIPFRHYLSVISKNWSSLFR